VLSDAERHQYAASGATLFTSRASIIRAIRRLRPVHRAQRPFEFRRHRQRPELALKQNQTMYIYRRQWPVFITVPYFEITGQIEAPANIDLRALMATGVERFVPVYNGTASLSINQSIRFSGELILINKTSIEVMCIGDKSSQ
jgi:hypothetical protein